MMEYAIFIAMVIVTIGFAWLWLKVYEVMKRANVVNQEACQSPLLKMRDEGLVKFDIHSGRWVIG